MVYEKEQFILRKVQTSIYFDFEDKDKMNTL